MVGLDPPTTLPEQAYFFIFLDATRTRYPNLENSFGCMSFNNFSDCSILNGTKYSGTWTAPHQKPPVPGLGCTAFHLGAVIVCAAMTGIITLTAARVVCLAFASAKATKGQVP
jgi:hypothetical protein